MNTATNTNQAAYVPPTPFELGCFTKVQYLNWSLVANCLHWKGSLHDEVAWYIRDEAWLLADGFGKVTLDWLDEQAWDWSHVRDSSAEAISAIAAYLRRNGLDLPADDYQAVANS